MAVVPCYICDKPMEIDDLIRHLRSHSDAESARVAARIARERRGNKAPTKATSIDTGVGTVVKKKSPEYIELDDNNQSVIESTNGPEPV